MEIFSQKENVMSLESLINLPFWHVFYKAGEVAVRSSSQVRMTDIDYTTNDSQVIHRMKAIQLKYEMSESICLYLTLMRL